MNKKTFRLALGGICTAVGTVALIFACIVPGVELCLYAISAVCVCIMAEETGLKGGVLVYAAIALLGFLLMPDKLGVLIYLVLFGLYPLFKLMAEKVKNRVACIALKVLFFAVVLGLTYGLGKELFFAHLRLPGWGIAGLIAYAVFMMILFDVILTFIVAFYRKRIKHEQDIKLSK